MNLRSEPQMLEAWYREHDNTSAIDASSSGVAPYSLGDVRSLVGISASELDEIEFIDSTSLGSASLRMEVGRAFGDGDPTKVVCTQGSNEAIFLVLHALLEPMDEVILLTPSYHATSTALTAVGCHVVEWKLDADSGFAPDVDKCAALMTHRTRAVIVNFPHNPTGVTLSLEQTQQLVDVASHHGAYLIWDEAFRELAHAHPPLPALATQYERAVTFGTLSKAYGLPGLRFGWAVAPGSVVRATIGLRDATTLFLSRLVEVIAERSIQGRSHLLTPRLETARANRELLLEWATTDSVAQMTVADGGVAVFVRLRNVRDGTAFARDLVKRGVLLVPGEAFGHRDWLRVGYGGDDRFGEALQIVSDCASASHAHRVGVV